MGTIRDEAWRESMGAGPEPVISATTLQSSSIRFAKGSVIHCATAAEALGLERLFGGELAREGLSLKAIRPVSLRIFFDRTYGMRARRVP
jgi:hypothetical protein